MPCYHPLIRIENLNSKYEKAKDGHKYRKAIIIKADDWQDRPEDADHENIIQRKQLIPCGKCIGCRLEYSREWANRGYCEAKIHKQNWFVTLTYDEDHITVLEEKKDSNDITYWNDGDWNGTLVGRDLTQFIKNVRQIMKREYEQDGIRFMGCGEYGSEGERPHYHIIFFNLNLPSETFFEPKIINHEMYYRNTVIERAWAGKGISNISEANWNNIAYTARYITKKINGKLSEEYYASKGQEKEFFRVSRMPGIGEPYYQIHKDEIYKNDEIVIQNKAGAIHTKPPKYFDMLYEREHPEEFKKIKEARKKQEKNKQKIKDETTSNTRLEQLEIEERSHEAKNLQLKREFESRK